MKTIRLSLVLMMLSIGIFSCKKDSTATDALSTDQVADLAAGSLSENSQGLATVTDDITANAQTLNAASTNGLTVNTTNGIGNPCGTTRTDSVTRAITKDSVSISYFMKYSHTVFCNPNNQRDSVMNTLTYHGNFDGPRVTSSNTGSAVFTVAGLSPDAANFTLHGEYKRSGQFQSKIGNKGTGNHSIDLVVKNLVLSKPGRKILSGTGTLTLVVNTPKKSINYTGSITFNGDDTASVTINGATYTINIQTGFRKRK